MSTLFPAGDGQIGRFSLRALPLLLPRYQNTYRLSAAVSATAPSTTLASASGDSRGTSS